MNDSPTLHLDEAPAAAVAPVVHQEPALGGSYTRDPVTGALIKAVPAPQPEDQE